MNNKIIFNIFDRYTASIYKPKEKKALLIRVLEPSGDDLKIRFREDYLDILELRFDDIGLEALTNSKYEKGFILFDKDMAFKIISFIGKYDHEFDEINVHCHAGVSRSSSIMMGILKMFNRDDIINKMMEVDKFIPNKLVLKVFNEVTKETSSFLGYEKCEFYSNCLEVTERDKRIAEMVNSMIKSSVL